ncbi:hypothetical protein B9G55_14825 [Saccharibacillus sp. O16]|nr:hypothetical protein B9G55_14825 [Saccharibacillus sp. O16]
MLEVKQVCKRYDGGRGVQNIDFSMQRGEIVGFLGPNGAGKTTTMRMITGYLYPTEGTITVDGLSVHDEARKARSKIGYLPETPPLYPDLTVEAYLKFVAKLRDVPTREQKLRVAEMVSRLGLTGRERQSIRHLSKGYKQRLGLAQAIIHKPDLLVLDEPTSGLDPSQIIEIRSLIRELGENHTVLLSTHILQEVGALCDRVLIINRGELVMDGAPGEIGARMENRFVVSVEVRGERERVESVLGDWAKTRGISAEIKAETKEGSAAHGLGTPASLPMEDAQEQTSSITESGHPDNVLVIPVVTDSPAAAEVSELEAQTGTSAEASEDLAKPAAEALVAEKTEKAAVQPAAPASVEAVQVVDLSAERPQQPLPKQPQAQIPAAQPASGVRAVLTASGQEDFRVELFRLLAEADLPILELHKENLTLEDVFIKLTEGDKTSTAPAEQSSVSGTQSGGEGQ